MTRVICCRWASSTALAWLVLSVVNALVPTQAQAGCNSPWVRHSGLDQSLYELRLLDAGFESLIADPWSRQPSDRRGPCAGGSCSRLPDRSPRSTIVISIDGEHWGDVPAEGADSVLPSREFSPEDDQRRHHCSRAPSNVLRVSIPRADALFAGDTISAGSFPSNDGLTTSWYGHLARVKHDMEDCAIYKAFAPC